MLVVFYGLAAIWGMRNVYFWQRSLLDLMIPLSVMIVLYAWTIADARRQRIPIPMFARTWLFLFAVIAVPGYVLWSRGWLGLAWLFLHLMGWYLVGAVCMHLVGTWIYGVEWLRAIQW
jgi:hypothetical protein